VHYTKATLLSLVLLLHLAGCIPAYPEVNRATSAPAALPTVEQQQQWLVDNPCGVMPIFYSYKT